MSSSLFYLFWKSNRRDSCARFAGKVTMHLGFPRTLGFPWHRTLPVKARTVLSKQGLLVTPLEGGGEVFAHGLSLTCLLLVSVPPPHVCCFLQPLISRPEVREGVHCFSRHGGVEICQLLLKVLARLFSCSVYLYLSFLSGLSATWTTSFYVTSWNNSNTSTYNCMKSNFYNFLLSVCIHAQPPTSASLIKLWHHLIS